MGKLNYSPNFIQVTGYQITFEANNSQEFELILYLLKQYTSLRSQLESGDSFLLFFLFFLYFLKIVLWVHCGIYKSPYNVSNISH
jgi:hypothetical protein